MTGKIVEPGEKELQEVSGEKNFPYIKAFQTFLRFWPALFHMQW
jgi:hypothetical protein